MDNQHRKIEGYRELNADEIDAMNTCKRVEAAVAGLVKELEQANVPFTDRGVPGPNDARSLALARTHFQTGFMWLVRAIAKPESGWD